jgi:hypothetical protein
MRGKVTGHGNGGKIKITNMTGAVITGGERLTKKWEKFQNHTDKKRYERIEKSGSAIKRKNLVKRNEEKYVTGVTREIKIMVTWRGGGGCSMGDLSFSHIYSLTNTLFLLQSRQF